MTTKKDSELATTVPKITVFGSLQNNHDEILYLDVPYNIRNNCQIGQWAIGEDKFIGNTLEIAILKVQAFYGKLGKSTSNWLQVFFVGAPGESKCPKNYVCVTYLKTRSLSQFGQKIIELMTSGEPGEGIFIGGFEKHQGELGTYYSVNFDWRERTPEEKPQLALIGNYLNSNPILLDRGLPETMLRITCEDDLTAAKQWLKEAV